MPEIIDDEGEILITEFLAHLAAFTKKETDACPHCKKTVIRLHKTGRCVYAQPCGCRLWQGKIPAAWSQP